MKEETTFENAKVGDEVWLFNTPATILENRRGWTYPIKFLLVNGETLTCTLSGKLSIDDNHQSVYWQKVEIIPPPRPKRKVMVKKEGWVERSEILSITPMDENQILDEGYVKVTYEQEVEE